jgi:hypothetical protein
MPRARCFGLRGAPSGGPSGFWEEITRASPLPRVAPNWTRPTGREPAVLSSRQQGTEEFLGGRNARRAGTEPQGWSPSQPDFLPARGARSTLVLLPRSLTRCLARRTARRCRRSPQLRNSPRRTVTRSSPGRSCHETSWTVNQNTTHPSAALWVRPLDRRRP